VNSANSGTGIKVAKSPRSDVAMVKTSTNFPIPNSVEAGRAWPALGPGNVENLMGSTLDCYGFGVNVANADGTGGSGAGTLRKAEDLPVESYDAPTDTLTLNVCNANQALFKGDSGCGCFTRDTNGNLGLQYINAGSRWNDFVDWPAFDYGMALNEMKVFINSRIYNDP
jgi:hypothetical protein